jgi:hypothetical protein
LSANRPGRVLPGLNHALLFAAVLVLAALLFACSSSDDDDGGGSGGSSATDSQPTATASGDSSSGGSSDAEIDACSILLPEDVEAEIGATPEPQPSTAGPFQSCAYFDTATNFVQFQACHCLQGDQFDDAARAGAEALEANLIQVDGVGDKAYWYAGLLWVQSGDVTFNLWISKAAYFEADGTALEGDALDAVALPDAKALAETLLGRM